MLVVKYLEIDELKCLIIGDKIQIDFSGILLLYLVLVGCWLYVDHIWICFVFHFSLIRIQYVSSLL